MTIAPERPVAPVQLPPGHTINVPLMQHVLDFIQDNPEHHDQRVWGWRKTEHPCRTTACFAGWTVLLAGRGVWTNEFTDGQQELLARNDDGTLYDVSFVAEKLLGLNKQQAQDMFYFGQTLDDLWDLAELFTNHEVKGPR